MRGPRRSTRAPIGSAYGVPQIIKGKIIEVNTVKHTVTVQGEGNEIHEGIQFMPRQLNPDGTGSFVTPETNMIVWLCTPSSEATPFVLGCAAVPKQTDADDDEDPNDFRMNRPVLNEGDEMVASRDSGYIIMRKGGILEVAASQVAKTFWMPVENLIQSFCESFAIDSPGGSLSLSIRDEDETWGADRSPVEFNLKVKEFADDPFDIFELKVGRIAEEDDQYIPIAGATGQIVVRLDVNRRFLVNIDKDGNFLKTVFGTEVESTERSKFVTVRQTFQQTVLGLSKYVLADRYAEVNGTDTLSVGLNRTLKVQGNLVETVGGSNTRTISGVVTETLGGVARTIQGDLEEKVFGPSSETVGGGKTISAGEKIAISAGGTISLEASNAPPTPLAPGIKLRSAVGDVEVTTGLLGNVVLGAGAATPSAPLAKISVRNSGSVLICTGPIGLPSAMEVNNTGAQMRTVAGSVTLGVNGAVSLGQPGGGMVVTTATHPFDYITGAPILGISTVTANGIPGVGPVGVPPTFVPVPV